MATSAASESGFAYQGRIRKDGFLVSGPTDLRFTLWTAANGGSQVGPHQEFVGVVVDKGLFALTLDFGSQAFTGEPRWIQLEVRHPAGSGSYTSVTPRQPMTSTPYSLFSLAGGEWTRIGANVHYSDGNVGIGTTSPGARLDVAGGSIRTSGQLISTAATGTAPLQVTSTTLVPNLNAALLDGSPSSAFGQLDAPQTWTGANTFSSGGNSFVGSGIGLTGLNGSNIATGTVANARTTATNENLPNTIVMRSGSGSFVATNITATNAVSGPGPNLTALNASNIATGTIANARTTGTNANVGNTLVLRNSSGSFNGHNITATAFFGSGANLTSLNASNISSGTVANAYTTATSSNTANTIVLRNADSAFNVRQIALTGDAQPRLRILSTANPQFDITTLPNGLHVIRVDNALKSTIFLENGDVQVIGQMFAEQYNTTSDGRLKTNVTPITDAMAILSAVDGVRHEWRDAPEGEPSHPDGVQIGFIAQDVLAVLPEAVTRNPNGYLAVDYSRLTPVLVEAVKELHGELLDRDAIIESLDDRVTRQERQIAALLDRLETLERAADAASSASGR